MGRAPYYFARYKGVILTLIVLALAVKVIVPQGFMVASGADGPSLVICTGHGPLVITGAEHGGKAPRDKKSDAPCAFSDNITPSAPSDVAKLSEPFGYAVRSLASDLAFDLTPGRGLAAPPPQSHAPPAILI